MSFPDEAVDGSVADRFLKVAQRFPERIAVSSPAGEWTYAALSRDVRQLAHRVVTADSGVLAPIAVAADHDGPLVRAMLACSLSGRPFVVLDQSAPDLELRHVLQDSGVAHVLCDSSQSDLVGRLISSLEQPPDILSLEVGSGSLLDAPIQRDAQDPLMLAFTSGTTGRSKAAVIPHGLLLNVVRGATRALAICPDDCLPMAFPASMAVAAYPAFLPLLNGGRLATFDLRSEGLGPFADFFVDQRITVAYLAPTIVRFMEDATRGRSFPDLRVLALGGELVDSQLVDLARRTFRPELLANGFGTTETGVIALHVVGPDDNLDGPVPSGRPVPDIELAIVDDFGREVGAGSSGEVLVRSPYLFHGYLGHPELSSKVLEPDPLGRPGWWSYRSGDVGRVDDHGVLTVLGRLDSTVKVRGRHVVLGDVEREVLALDDVEQAAVVPVVENGVTELGAMVVSTGVEPFQPVDARRSLLKDHQSFRVPTRWRVVEELPQLPNGKVDRRSVIRDFSSVDASELDAGHAGPLASSGSGEVASTIRRVWEDLLPVDLVGPDDDFGLLGGDSLRAAQMIIMVEQRLGVRVPMSVLLHSSTLRRLTSVVSDLVDDLDRDRSTVACVQAGESSQPRLWFLPDLPGSAYRVRHVAEELGPRQPVWSFDSPLLAGEPNGFEDLPSFVARFVADLRVEQPVGPYWLAGYSFGGPCAYEMALQLRAMGEEVALLAIVDTGPGYRGPNWRPTHSPPWPYFGVPGPPPPESSAWDAGRYYASIFARSPRAAARHLTIRSGVARYIDGLRFASDLRRLGRVRPEWRLWYAWEQHWRLATKAWDRTQPYDGRLDLLWASRTGSTDSSMGWEPLVADLRIHRFDGYHDHLLETVGAPEVARALLGVIDDLNRSTRWTERGSCTRPPADLHP